MEKSRGGGRRLEISWKTLKSERYIDQLIDAIVTK
jgi:hypothetical protein